ncbi:MAG: tetratricopeptide repeat protein [Candidatus Poribacteria bacterium]|nr:tetratricopeptide repeat protein [Candidatus Poribacteria bacterium]
MNKPLKVFITYSHKNTAEKDELITRLALLKREGIISIWHDNEILPGDKWRDAIFYNLADSDLLLYLTSAHSLDSENCNKELASALNAEIRVIPIILENCDWLNHQLSDFQALPDKGNPINKWQPESEGWQNVVDGIRNTVDEMQIQAKSSSENVQNRRLAEWVFQQGNFLLMLNQINMAIEAYSHAIDLNPDNADAYINRGATYIKKGKHDLAIENCNKAIQLRPDYALTYSNRGVAYDKKGEHDLAISDYDKAIELKPNYADAYNNRGNAYGNKGEHDRAIIDYTKAIELNSEFADAYHNRGVAYYSKNDFDQAITDYTKAIELNPKFTNAYYNRSIVYAEKDNFDLAIQDSARTIELNPNFAEAYHNRGVVYAKKGNYDFAIKNYTRAIELKPEFTIYYDRGIAYSNKGDFDYAIKDYTKAIELNTIFSKAYINRGNAYSNKGDFGQAIEDYTKAIELAFNPADAYNNRGVVYVKKDDIIRALEDYTKAIELNPNRDIPYYNRGVVWLHLREWEKAKTDLTTAKKKGMDIIASFRDGYKNVESYEKQHRVKLPEDIALLLTQRRRDRYPKLQKVLDADGKPLESPNVVNLREQLRNAGIPLGEYVKTKPAFGINTTPTEAFVVDKATRDKLIAAHPSSADILKRFLYGQDLRRWHVNTPHQWLIFAHRGIAINDYPAILKHLEKYQETLSKRKGKQKWYELPVSLGDMERFAQPKLVCPDTYNHQTFAVDTVGYYYGKTSYLIPTEEKWLCGLLNSRTVEWFYSQVSNQLTIDPLRARSGYIQQIPIPDITPVHKALIAKIVDYLIYLQQRPEINSKDLKYARDRIMLGYFERVIDGLIYEAYLPVELHKSDKVFLQPLLDEGLPSIEEIQGDKMSAFRDIFELLYDRMHLVRRHLYYLDVIKPIRVIQGKL